MKKGIGGHQSASMRTYEWLTPPEIITSLGQFDLDPCAPIKRHWDTAATHYTIIDNGLSKEWFGRVWLNPPYGDECINWMKKLTEHGNGTSLIFARTETEMFFKYVWDIADSIFFFEGRLHFHNTAGQRAKKNAGAPSCLIAYGKNNVDAIEDSKLKGKHIRLNYAPIIIIGISPSWKSVVTLAINRLNKEATIQEIYDMVEQIAPDKVNGNKFYKEKIRQKVQEVLTRTKRGHYCNVA